jgi:hypothetical protein
MNLEERKAIRAEARKRISQMDLGDPVTNISAGPAPEGAPHLRFVEPKIIGGVLHARVKSRTGKFFEVNAKSIYPGHLEESDRSVLFEKIKSCLIPGA